ncbi:4Fe-4S dicluster domain-containing protein [Thermodesulfobacteriota bacterium]
MKRYGLVIDVERCIGCDTCAVACKAEHFIEQGSRLQVLTVGGAHPDTPAGVYPNLRMDFFPKTCMHCADAPCIRACPEQAINKREDGIVLVEESECTGCWLCVEECPYGAINVPEDKNIIDKCDLCYERVDEGEVPFCVYCCETNAMHFGDLNDPDSTVSRLIKEKKAYNLLPEKKTKPAVFYFNPGERIGY